MKKIKFETYFLILVIFFGAGSIMQNILAVKTFGSVNISIATAGTLISWLVFLAMDILTEVWGKKIAIKTFMITAIISLLFTGVAWIAIIIPGTSPDFIDPQYATILGTGWRIALGSIIAFIGGNYINTIIMHTMRVKSKDKNNTFSFMARAILSTLVGQLFDNAIFYFVAFAPLGIASTIEHGFLDLLTLIGIVTVIETVIEAIISPLTAKIVRKLKEVKKQENIITSADIDDEKEALKCQETTNN